MPDHTKCWIEFTLSNLPSSEFPDPVPEFLAVLRICMDRNPTVLDGWFIIKPFWIFFKGCFEIFCLYWIVLYKAINCAWSGFGFRRRSSLDKSLAIPTRYSFHFLDD